MPGSLEALRLNIFSKNLQASLLPSLRAFQLFYSSTSFVLLSFTLKWVMAFE